MKYTIILLAALVSAGCVVTETYERVGYHGGGDARNGIVLGFSGSLFETKSYLVTDTYAYDMGGRHHPMMTSYTTVQNVIVQDPDAANVINYMESRGFIVRAAANQVRFTIDLNLTRTNIQKPGDFWLVFLSSITTCDRAEFVYHLNAKVYDTATGDVVYSQTYDHEGAKVVYNILPLIYTSASSEASEVNSPAAITRTSWFYAALDDIAAHIK